MKAEELIHILHKVSNDIRYVVKVCSALKMTELEIAIARTADTLSDTKNIEKRARYTNLGRLLVLYREDRAKGLVKVRTLKRLSLWHSSGEHSLLDFAINVMLSMQFSDDAISMLSSEDISVIIRGNGR